jgi:hypothetical protein
MWQKIKGARKPIAEVLVLLSVIWIIAYTFSFFDKLNTHTSETLKEFKDGIQNHLVFDIKGRCFFVRPKDDVTVYLISVPDCDRK